MSFVQPRIVPAIACAISVALCLLYASYRSDLPHWWSQFGGGVPYVLFWILFVYMIVPSPRYIFRITVAVVLGTCLLEVLQLWHPDWLAEFRRTKFGAALLGSTFVWNDFPPYFIGGAIGYACLWLMTKRGQSKAPLSDAD